MLKTLLGPISLKRYIVTFIAVFAFIFLSDFLIHGVLLAGMYKATAPLWRPEEEMSHYMVWMILGQMAAAKGFSLLFARGYEGKGLGEGFRFGLFVYPLVAAPCLINYAVMPLPLSLVLTWVGIYFVQVILIGLVAAAVYGYGHHR